MRVVCLILLIAVIVAVNADSTHYEVKDAPKLFEDFVKRFNKQYKDEADRKHHYEAFVRNLDTINEMNAISPETTYGITQFADYTDDEKMMA